MPSPSGGRIRRFAVTACIWLAVLVAAYAALVLEGHLMNLTEWRFNARLQEAVDQGRKEIRISDLTDFPWTRMCWFGPYANRYTYGHIPEIRELFEGGHLEHPWVGSENYWGMVFRVKEDATEAIRISKPFLPPSGAWVPVVDAMPVQHCMDRAVASALIVTHNGYHYAQPHVRLP